MSFPSDLEIARQAHLQPIVQIAEEMGLPRELLEQYGDSVLKIKLRGHRGARRPPEGEVRLRDRHHADTARGRQDDDDRRPRAGDEPHRQAGHHRHTTAVDGPDVRHQGRCRRRRLQPGRAHGDVQPPPHGRHARRYGGAQHVVGDGGQPPLPGQRPRTRSAQHHLAAGARRQRPGAAQHRHRPRDQGRRRAPPDGFRHHGRLAR